MAHSHVIRVPSRNLGKTARFALITGDGPTKPGTANFLCFSLNPKSKIQNPKSPTTPPMIPDHNKSSTFKLAGKLGRVIPLFIDETSHHHHSRHFQVEFPLDGKTLYHLDAARLVAVIGDGGARRHFSAPEVARILSNLSPKLDHHKFLQAVAP